MFGMGMPEIILILVIALIVIGPKKLPELAKSLGRSIGEFKKATHEFKEAIDVKDEVKNFKKPFDGLSSDLKESISVAENTSTSPVSNTKVTPSPLPSEETQTAKKDKDSIDE